MARDSLGFLPLLCFVSASRRILSDSRLLMGVLLLCSHCFRRKSIIASCRFDTQSLVSLVLCLFYGTGELVHRISGESNVWSGLQRMWWPDQDFVNPASPVLLSESPSGWSAVPRTVLRLLTPMISSLGAGSDTKLKLRSPEASKLL
ncbi:unnamed protein product [Brassica napus]|uniref:(rape) hypothetical protein n=1 Tax=Brassica napus TaxID=3708 RepID=A0A816ILA0_BRANA|nr:unnamed protein product [Brassica napus]